jgi:hypothetical protein
MISKPPIFLEIDAPTLSGVWLYGFVVDGLAALARPHITHDEAYSRSRALGDRFFSGLTTHLVGGGARSVDRCRSAVALAAMAAVDSDADFMRQHNGYLTFSVVVSRGDEWLVFQLGPEMSLHIRDASYRKVLAPHSAMQRAIDEGDSAEWARGLAGVPTGAVIPGRPFEAEIRDARVILAPSEWLLIAPESGAIVDLKLTEQPADVDAIRRLVEQLASPYAQHNRSWLAVRG